MGLILYLKEGGEPPPLAEAAVMSVSDSDLAMLSGVNRLHKMWPYIPILDLLSSPRVLNPSSSSTSYGTDEDVVAPGEE